MIVQLHEKDICAAGLADFFGDDPQAVNIPPDEKEVELCRRFIRETCSPSKTGHSSYGFKHEVERRFGEYISNGAAILAAVREGVEQHRIKIGPNTIIMLEYKK